MEIGIVGLPNVGKSTLFNALALAQAPASNYPYCTIEPNVAVVEVKDERLSQLSDIVNPKKLTHPLLKFVDIAGLARGASRGEGLGNMFLSHVRNVDAIAHVVRCFEDKSVVHVEGDIDPKRDVEIVETELLLSDIEILDRKIAKLQKVAKGVAPRAKKELEFLKHLRSLLNEGSRFDDTRGLDLELAESFKDLRLLWMKPTVFVSNSDEDPASETKRKCKAVLEEIARQRNTVSVDICAKLEAEISELPPEEVRAMLREMGFQESALERFVRACYDLLQVVTFFTVKGEETRGWTVQDGTMVKEAAGRIHSDMYDRFICAEVISFTDFVSSGGMTGAKEKGLVRTEGKSYTVRDGDVVLIKFGR